MQCAYCDKQLEAKKVTYNVNRNGYDVILHDVPALVCKECGEIFYAEKSVELIQEMIEEVDAKSEAVRASDLDKYPFVLRDK